VKIGRLELERDPLYESPEDVVERLGRTGGGNDTEGGTLVDGAGGREGMEGAGAEGTALG